MTLDEVVEAAVAGDLRGLVVKGEQRTVKARRAKLDNDARRLQIDLLRITPEQR